MHAARTPSPRSSAIALGVVALLTFGLSTSASARVYLPEASAGDDDDGHCSLREALTAAAWDMQEDTCEPGEENDFIYLAAGTYPFSGGQFALSFTGTIEIDGLDPDPMNVVVDLGSTNRFLSQNVDGTTITVRGFTIQNGDTDYGGALLQSAGTLVVDRMRLTGNVALIAGGGLAMLNGGTLQVTNSTFVGNFADQMGGGIFVYAPSGGAASIRHTTFQANNVVAAETASGGGLEVEAAGGSISVLNCLFDKNVVSGSSPGYSLGGGAELYAHDGGRIDVVDTDFFGSQAKGDADEHIAALNVISDFGATVSLNRIVVDQSTTEVASAANPDVSLSAVRDGVVTLTDSLLARGSGSGVMAVAGHGAAQVSIGQTTVTGYASGTGLTMGHDATGKDFLQNSLVTGNLTDVADLTPIQATGNCVSLASSPFVGGGDFHIVAGSLAENAGTDGIPTLGSADLDHHARVVGSHPDCGAYELGGLLADGFETGSLEWWPGRLGGL